MTITTTLQTNGDAGIPYDQFILFGDSITQMSYNQDLGFGFGAQLQEGKFVASVQLASHTDCFISLRPQARCHQQGILVRTIDTNAQIDQDSPWTEDTPRPMLSRSFPSSFLRLNSPTCDSWYAHSTPMPMLRKH